MTKNLKKFFNTVDRLKEIGVEVSEDLLAILLLCSIPNIYENFRCAIEARDSLPTPEALKIKLPCLKFRTNSGLRKLSETVRNQGGFRHPDFIRSSPELVRSSSSELESELNTI